MGSMPVDTARQRAYTEPMNTLRQYPQTKPCRLCGKNMIEDGDGWCAGEPGSPAGFYSAHWACTNTDPKGAWGLAAYFEGRAQSGKPERFNNQLRAMEQAQFLSRNNSQNWKFVVLLDGAEVYSITGALAPFKG